MNWERGYSASYYMMEVDPDTWRDVERFEIISGSISRTLDGMRQSADVDCKEYPRDKERWIRIYQDASQLGDGAHTALFTGLATSPDINVKGTWMENTVVCYSVLKPAEDVILQRGYYAPAGTSVTTILRDLLAPVPSPVVFYDEAPSLVYPIVAESGETNLSMIGNVLSAINWNLRIEGNGTIKFGPYEAEPVATFDPLGYPVIETEFSISSDWFSCPNCFMVSCNGVTAIAKDDDINSPLSVQNRGREVWVYESGDSLNENETLNEYARRRLSEEQEYITTASYDRRFIPEVMPGDMVSLHYPQQGLNGDFLVTSQNIELSYAARTSEEIVGVL